MLGISLSIPGDDQPRHFWSSPAYLAAIAGTGERAGPAAILDFSGARHALTNVPAADIESASIARLSEVSTRRFSQLVNFTRPGTATYVDAYGLFQTADVDEPRFDFTHGRRQLLLEGPGTNLLLNSDVLTAQSVTVSATPYVLSFYGTGTVTMTGAYSGVLPGIGSNSRIFAAFTPSAGALTLTVSGSVTFAQLETGSYPSSYIPTAGSAVTRPADNAQLAEPVAALLRSGEASVLVQGEGLNGRNGRILSGPGGTDYICIINAPGDRILAGYPSIIVADSITLPLPAFGLTVSLSGTTISASYQEGAIQSRNDAQQANLTTVYIGRNGAGSAAPGWYSQLVIWPFRMTDADLQAKAVPHA